MHLHVKVTEEVYVKKEARGLLSLPTWFNQRANRFNSIILGFPCLISFWSISNYEITDHSPNCTKTIYFLTIHMSYRLSVV